MALNGSTVAIRLALQGQGEVVRGVREVNQSMADMGRVMKSLVGGLSIGAAVGKLVSVQREFDVLNASLVTVTGSSEAAAREFAWIKEFATTTPYQLQEVTGAFVKMKALGLDASADALRSYGNTASAMGKSLDQMIEAVADAATGEFERLKEFGIKARKNGDDVSLIFKGVTTTIKNNSEEITQYLRRIGDVDFAGANERRMKTLDGAISNLADTWDELFRTVSDSDAGGLIYDSVRLASGALGDAVKIMGAFNSAVKQVSTDTGALVTIQNGLATVFETVAVLGNNVKFILMSVGRELGGIAAQAVQILQGNFSGAAAIRREMIADAEAARRQLDATDRAILSARSMAAIAATGKGMDEPRFARLLNPTTGGTSPSGGGDGDSKKKKSDADRYLENLRGQLEATKNLSVAEQLRLDIELGRLGVVGPARRKELEDLARQIDAARAAADSEKTLAEIRGRTLELGQRDVDQAVTRADQLMQSNADLRAEIELIGLDDNARKALLITKEQEVLADQESLLLAMKNADASQEVIAAMEREIELRRQRIGLLRTRDSKDDLVEEDRRNQEMSTRLADSIEEGLLNGFRNGRNVTDVFLTELKAQFGKTVLRPMIEPVAKAGGELLSQGVSWLLKNLMSFDGGGHTGNGPRAGGLDGRGGFLAMMHPQETVTDHTRPGSGGRQVVVQQTYQFNGPADKAQVLAAAQLGAAMAKREIADDMMRGRS